MTLYRDGRGSERGILTRRVAEILTGKGPLPEDVIVSRVLLEFPDLTWEHVHRRLARMLVEPTWKARHLRRHQDGRFELG